MIELLDTMKNMAGIFKLEEEYAKFDGSKYAVVVNSGTAALHVSLVALGIGKGDEVIVPDFTMAACGFAVSYTGAKVVTVDCKEDLTIDEAQIEAKISKKTKAIMPVHIYGQLCNMDEIYRIAKKHNLFVIEDACEAQGVIYQSKADVTCYSFYKNKIIHAEEGGMVTTDNEEIASKIKYLKNMAFNPDHTYYHAEIGFNYRMPESQALMALKSLKDYKKNVEKRFEIVSFFEKHLGEEFDGWAPWVFPSSLEYKPQHFELGVRKFFTPLSMMPMWKQKTGERAKAIHNRCYFIINPYQFEKDVKIICRKYKTL